MATVRAPPLGRIGRIVLTVLGAVLAFFFVVGIVVLLDPAEAVDGAGVWLTGLRRRRCGDHAAGRPAEAPYIK